MFPSMQIVLDVQIPELFGGCGGRSIYIGTLCTCFVHDIYNLDMDRFNNDYK